MTCCLCWCLNAIAATLPGSSRQRCRTHYARNLASMVPKGAVSGVMTLLRTVFEQPDAQAIRTQMDHVIGQLQGRFPATATHLEEAREDLLAFAICPRAAWKQIWSNNPQERLDKEIRRAPTSWASFPTAPRSPAWSPLHWPSRPTNGPGSAATSARPSSPNATPPAPLSRTPTAHPTTGRIASNRAHCGGSRRPIETPLQRT
uniref:transposase n=1 Tax=Streptomyces malaysiensis TaxID=92644 RepID=UPI00384CEBAF